MDEPGDGDEPCNDLENLLYAMCGFAKPRELDRAIAFLAELGLQAIRPEPVDRSTQQICFLAAPGRYGVGLVGASRFDVNASAPTGQPTGGGPMGDLRSDLGSSVSQPVTLSYGSSGDLLTRQDGGHAPVAYTYDPAGRLTRADLATTPQGTGDTPDPEMITRDALLPDHLGFPSAYSPGRGSSVFDRLENRAMLSHVSRVLQEESTSVNMTVYVTMNNESVKRGRAPETE